MNVKQKRRLLRLINLLGLIKDKTGVRAKDLASQCGVSIRTFFRDLRILERAGFPVLYRKGYRIFSNFSLEPVNFTLDEILTIRAGANHLIHYLQYADSAESVLKKIEKILLNKSKGLLKILASDKTQPMLFEMIQDSPDFFGLLKTSIQKKQAVFISFLDENKNFLEKVLWPESLVFKFDGWVFTGRDLKTKEKIEIPFEKLLKVRQTVFESLQKVKVKKKKKY